jgi:hypothetical protein
VWYNSKSKSVVLQHLVSDLLPVLEPNMETNKIKVIRYIMAHIFHVISI